MHGYKYTVVVYHWSRGNNRVDRLYRRCTPFHRERDADLLMSRFTGRKVVLRRMYAHDVLVRSEGNLAARDLWLIHSAICNGDGARLMQSGFVPPHVVMEEALCL